MVDLDEITVTQATIEQMSTTTNPRLKQIMESAVRHLHAFARDVSLTPEEWVYGIKFMTQIGQTCTPFRQEFILLSDTLGLSRMVNILHDGRGETVGTETSLLGPFYREKSPELDLGASIAANPDSEEIVLFGRVLDDDGAPIAHATVEVWQTDPEGYYDLQMNAPENMDFRATFRTDAEGNYNFRATLPLGYEIPLDGPVGEMIRAQHRHGCRPAHTHFLIGAPGYRELVTAVYYGYDQYINTDVVFGVSTSLIVDPKHDVPGSPVPGLRAIHYDFALSREKEGETTGRVGSDPSKMMANA